MSFLVSKLLLKNDTKITEKEKQILTFIINNGPSKVIEILNALGFSITTIKNVEKSGTEFQRINELCVTKNVSWTFRKVAYGFYFEFIRTNVQINVHLTDQEQAIFNLILSNERISKEELAIRINKSEKTIQKFHYFEKVEKMKQKLSKHRNKNFQNTENHFIGGWGKNIFYILWNKSKIKVPHL